MEADGATAGKVTPSGQGLAAGSGGNGSTQSGHVPSSGDGRPRFGAASSRAVSIGLALALHVAAVALLLVLGSEPHAQPVVQTISLVDLDAAAPPPAPTPPAKLPPPRSEEPAPATEPNRAPTHLPAPRPTPAAPVRPAPAPSEAPPQGVPSNEPDYLPQYQITAVPVFPVATILSRIQYPPLAARLGIEATVFLELYIDEHGVIRKIVVLKDPGYGFAEAAVRALQGLTVTPAEANGKPVAVRFRYPIRFTSK